MKEVINISLKKLRPNPHNARNKNDYNKDDPSMQDLMEDIKIHGIVTPLKVLKDGKILFGNRRFYAAKYIGLKNVPCIVDSDNIDSIEQLMQQVSENMIRKYPSILERGKAFRELIDSGAVTEKELKERTGAKDIGTCLRLWKNFQDAEKQNKKRVNSVMKDVRQRPNYSTIAEVIFKRTAIPGQSKIDLLEAITEKKNKYVTTHHIETVAQELIKKAKNEIIVSKEGIKQMLSEAMETDEHQVLMRRKDWTWFKEDWLSIPKKTRPATLRHYFIEVLKKTYKAIENAGNYSEYIKKES